MPLLVPENGHPDELLRDHDGLLHQCTAVFPHVLQDALCSFLPALVLAFSGHSQGIDQGLYGAQSGDRSGPVWGTVRGQIRACMGHSQGIDQCLYVTQSRDRSGPVCGTVRG